MERRRGLQFWCLCKELQPAALACSEGEEVVVTDVTCAYVDASMPKDNPEKVVFLRVDALVAPMAQYVTQSGTIMVELDRALYGCIESARLWFDELLSTLKSMGLVGFLR